MGEFYRQLEDELARRPESDFGNNPDLQLMENDLNYDGELTVIGTKELVGNKLKLIVRQGEGSGDPLSHTESHYNTFRHLAEIATTWELYSVRKNPKTIDYRGLGNPKHYTYKLSLTFDASYCYLLQNIQRVWAKGGAELHERLVKNISNLMHRIFAPLAEILTGDSDVAAPCFNYFPVSDDGEPLTPLKPRVLHSEALRLVKEAREIAPEGDKPSLGKVVERIVESQPE